jgi:uncharacterized protein YggE
MFRILSIALLAASLGGASFAQSAEPSQITVVGFGSAERAADWAKVSMDVIGEGKTSIEALQALTALQERLTSRLGSLQGATSMQVETSQLKISEVRGRECNAASYRPATLSEGPCAIVGYVAQLSMTVKIAPGNRAGDAASLAAELGGRNVALASFGLNETASLTSAATEMAVRNAKAQAAIIAKASGVRLGPILRVQDPSALEIDRGPAPARPDIALSGNRFAPIVSVAITVPPVRQNARLSVVFSILP